MTEPTPITTAPSKRPRAPRASKGESRDNDAPATPHSQGPARGYRWEPFENGNQAALVHGAYSPVLVGDLAAEIAQAAVDAAPQLALDLFQFALRAWSHAEARAELIRRHLDAVGVLNNRSTPRTSLLAVLAASERAASRGRDELGLSPASAASILRSLREAALAGELLSPAERLQLQEGR